MTPDISPLASARLAAWHSRRPGFALMGEYSSGKSALLNLLLGRRILPTRVTATDLPAVWLTHGKTEKVVGLAHDGGLHDLALKDLTSGRALAFLAIRIETDADILSGVDIIDTPGISDPRMSTRIVEEVAAVCDFVLWCSPANQAWRQTERAFWKSMPDRLKRHSLLVLTRVDKMRTAEDLEKVMHRCTTETRGQFSAILPMSTLAAIAALGDGTSAEFQPGWSASGAARLLEHLDQSIRAAATACASRPTLPDPASAAKPKSEKAKAAQSRQPRIASAPSIPATLLKALSELRNNEAGSFASPRILAEIRHLFNKLAQDTALTEEHRDVLSRSLTVDAAFNGDVSKVVSQVEREVKDFADNPWCEVGK